MQKSITQISLILSASFLFLLTATMAYAADEVAALAAIEEAQEAIDDAEVYIDTLGSNDREELEDDFGEAQEAIDDAKVALVDEDYEEAVDFAEEAEKIAKEILDYEDDKLEDEIEDSEDAIKDAEAEIAEAELLLEDYAEDDKETYEDWLAAAKGYLVDAQEAFEAEDYEEAVDFAEKAEDKAKDIQDALDEDEDEDEDDKDVSKFCENTKQAAGWGVAKKCVNEDGWQVNNKLEQKVDRFSNYGKSTDKNELQSQLRELLLVLIQLLQQQMDQQDN